VLFEDGIYPPCESGGGGGGGEKLVVRAEASIVGGLGVWLGLCHFVRVSEKSGTQVHGKKINLPGIRRQRSATGAVA
jgi:hypothetical protein